MSNLHEARREERDSLAEFKRWREYAARTPGFIPFP